MLVTSIHERQLQGEASERVLAAFGHCGRSALRRQRGNVDLSRVEPQSLALKTERAQSQIPPVIFVFLILNIVRVILSQSNYTNVLQLLLASRVPN